MKFVLNRTIAWRNWRKHHTLRVMTCASSIGRLGRTCARAAPDGRVFLVPIRRILRQVGSGLLSLALALPAQATSRQPLNKSPRLPSGSLQANKTGFKSQQVSTFRHRGEEYTTMRHFGPSNREVAQLIVGRGLVDIKVDDTGDGIPDRWEISNGRHRMKASGRARSGFSRLEVEERTRSGVKKLKFLLSPGGQEYRLVASYVEPYKSSHADLPNDIIVGDVCTMTQGPSLTDFVHEWKTTLNELLERGERDRRDQLGCFVNKYERFLFDSSCFREPFQTSLQDIKDGLRDVMASSASAGVPGKPAKYLQCLREQGLPTHSLRMEAYLWERIRDAQRALRLSDEQKSDVCSEPEPLTADVEKRLSTRVRPFRCDKAENPEWRGTYSFSAQQVTLRQPSSEMARAFGTGVSPKDGFASTIFHELIHASLISDEILVHNAEACCSGLTSATKVACSTLQSLTSRIRSIEEHEAKLAIRDARFAGVVADINRVFPRAEAEELLNNYLYEAAQVEIEAEQDFLRCRRSGADESECKVQMKSKLAAHSREYFDTSCPAARKASGPAYQQLINCDALRDRMAIAVSERARQSGESDMTGSIAEGRGAAAGSQGGSVRQASSANNAPATAAATGEAAGSASVARAGTATQPEARIGQTDFIDFKRNSEPVGAGRDVGLSLGILSFAMQNLKDLFGALLPLAQIPGAPSGAVGSLFAGLSAGAFAGVMSASSGRSPQSRSPQSVSPKSLNQSQLATAGVSPAASMANALPTAHMLSEVTQQTIPNFIGGGGRGGSDETGLGAPSLSSERSKTSQTAQTGDGRIQRKASSLKPIVNGRNLGGLKSSSPASTGATLSEEPRSDNEEPSRQAEQDAEQDTKQDAEQNPTKKRKGEPQKEELQKVERAPSSNLSPRTKIILSESQIASILRGPYSEVQSRLKDPRFQAALSRNGIQVEGSSGQVYGAEQPSVKFEFCARTQALTKSGECYAP